MSGPLSGSPTTRPELVPGTSVVRALDVNLTECRNYLATDEHSFKHWFEYLFHVAGSRLLVNEIPFLASECRIQINE
jgi:hypothetical protein